MKNTIPKTLHFGFFRAFLLLNRDDIEHKIKKLKKSLKPDDARRAQVFEQLLKDSKNTPEFIWKILNDIDSNKLESAREISNKMIEIDKSTFIISEEDEHIFFQMVHDRDDALSKKRINKERESIHLDDDEYISEFASIIYNKTTNCFMIQKNRFSVSPVQIGYFLNECIYEKYFVKMNVKYGHRPLKVDLRPIMDMGQLDAIKNNKGIDRIEIKGSMSSLENLNKTNYNLPVLNVGKTLKNMKGYSFAITITANHERINKKVEYDSIDKEECEKLYSAYSEVPEGKDNISVKMHYTNEAEIKDTLTWATPLKLAEITFNHNPRSEIKVIEIYKKMIEVFNANKEDVKRLSD